MPRVIVAAALAVLAGSPLARAQEASFDCLKAAAPVEQLICSDPELLALDEALGEAFRTTRQRPTGPQRDAALAEQRTWLAERLSRCGVPAKGDEIADELRWRAAPCLDEMYRARLAALGTPPQPIAPAPAAASASGFIHPACLWPIVEQEPDDGRQPPRVPLAACGRGNRHIPVGEAEEGLFSAQGASDGYITWLAYRTIGVLPDGRTAAVVWYNSGGTGVFSEMYLLRRTSSADGRDMLISGDLVGGGGDRCNGGIEQAKLIDQRTLEVDYRVTPQDLLSEADEQLANDNIDALAFCAICCTGTVRRRLDLASKDEKTVSAKVDQLLSEEPAGDGDPAQACFDTLIRKRAPALPHTFSAEDLRGLAAAFAKQCTGR
jgi:uncharacterized protein